MILSPYAKFVNKLTIFQIMDLLVQDCDSSVIRSAQPGHLQVRVWRQKIRLSQLMDLKFRAVWATNLLIESAHGGFGAPCSQGKFN